MIYKILNPIEQTVNYVCETQAIIDQGKLYKYDGIFSIGGRPEADLITIQNKTNWMNENLHLFTVTKDIDPDPIQTTWVVCDLETELENTNIDYNIFNILNGSYVTVSGLSNAKSAVEVEKETVSNYFVQMDEFENWEVPRELPISQGTQEF